MRLRSEYKVDLIQVEREVLFFSKEKYIVPHLKLLHRYPDMLPKQVVDVGAVGPLLNGSDVMAPGLLTAAAQLNPVRGAGNI